MNEELIVGLLIITLLLSIINMVLNFIAIGDHDKMIKKSKRRWRELKDFYHGR